MTPKHLPVLLEEALEALALKPSGTYVDGTFGRGGHSRAILARLGPAGRLLALDRDPQAVAAAREIADARFSIAQAKFSTLSRTLGALGVSAVDGMLFDLGVSSPQFDDPARGFSFRAEGPLDMRMDPTSGTSAGEWLATASEREIGEAIRTYGEERFAQQIAKAIVAARGSEPLRSTRQLADLVGAAVRTREAGQDPATRTFQALRSLVNRELEEVQVMLPQARALRAPAGRRAVVSVHSREDRIVKRFMQSQARPEVPRGLPLRASEMPEATLSIVGRAIRPGEGEVRANPRARSAILRTAQRTTAPWRS